MSSPGTLEAGAAPVPEPSAVGPGPGRGTWRLTRHGLGTVVRLELRQRVRSTRWLLMLALWVAAVGALSVLIWLATRGLGDATLADDGYVGADPVVHTAGRTMFGAIVFLVLALGSLIAPALSATSINGDRAAGVLALLQTTLLSPAELVLGRLAAAWFTSLALLVTALPFVLWGAALGAVTPGKVLVTLAVLAATLLVVCAIGLGWSAITARTTSSAVLTYLCVAVLGLGLPILFGLTLPLVTSAERVQVVQWEPTGADPATGDEDDPDAFADGRCLRSTQVLDRTHSERTWWLLAPSPFVIVADAAAPGGDDLWADDPLSAIRYGVREARLGPAEAEDWCGEGEWGTRWQQERDERAAAFGPVWPYGLVLDLAIGTAFTLGAVRRLRTPTRRLPRGVRVA